MPTNSDEMAKPVRHFFFPQRKLAADVNKHTAGKMVVGICVVDLDGERVGWPRASARNCLKLVSAGSAFAGFLVAAFTPDKQTLHDLMASTPVVIEKWTVA